MDELLPLLVSPFIGSLLGTVVRRLPHGRALVLARSACEACGRVLAPRDLVPLLSFLWLRGRCRTCRASIAPFHLGIELAAVAVAGWAILVVPDQPAQLWADCVLGWTLLALAVIDAEHLRLPDVLTLPLVVLGLLATAWLDPDAAAEHAAAAALGFLAFQGVAYAYRWLRRREGLGGGDAKLLAASGAWVGLDGLSHVVLGGALLALLVTLAGLLVAHRALPQRRRQRRAAPGGGTPIPFGPYLALATWIIRLHSGLAGP